MNQSRQTARRRGLCPALSGVGKELLVAASLLAAVGVFHVWSHTRVVAAGYLLYDLQQEHARLTAAQDELRIELGMLTSPQALDLAARTKLSKLGLAPPDRGAVWAAGSGRDAGGLGRAGVDGVDHPSRPAEPIVGQREGRRASAFGPPRPTPATEVALRSTDSRARGLAP